VEKYQDNISARWTARYDASIDLVGDFKGRKILDVGCSLGWFEQAAVGKGCEYIVGIDDNPKLLFAGARAIPQAHFCQAGAQILPFKDNSFDLATIWEVIEHLPRKDVNTALREIRRVLKPDGYLFLSTPKFDLRSTLLDPAWYLGHRHYRQDTLIKLLRQNGFRLIRIQSGGAFFEVLYILLFYPFKHLASREVPGKSFFENRRNREYAQERGWSTYFLEAGKG
jgi:ubiquinone/menaquinone biosynthesis C-methylase UbiE